MSAYTASTTVHNSVPATGAQEEDPAAAGTTTGEKEGASVGYPVAQASDSIQHETLVEVSESTRPRAVPAYTSEEYASSEPEPEHVGVLTGRFNYSVDS